LISVYAKIVFTVIQMYYLSIYQCYEVLSQNCRCSSGTRTHVGRAWLFLWGIDWMVVVCYWL